MVKVAAIQFQCVMEYEENINKAIKLATQAAENGANIILLQELFATDYFCIVERSENFALAVKSEAEFMKPFIEIAKKYEVVLPISYFESSNNAYYNSVVMIDETGSIIGKYRKSHIPDSLGYREKYYFTPGDKNYDVFETKYGKIGIGICWDQWFPEHSRILALKGADIILFPTAIGTEPSDPNGFTYQHWETVICGHSAANMLPIVVSNRIGLEKKDFHFGEIYIDFYGQSFITNNLGEIISFASENQEEIIYSEFDFEKYKADRAAWGIFRDRRPDLYESILTKDGKKPYERM